MVSLRLPAELENQVKMLSKSKHCSITEIFKVAVTEYLAKFEGTHSPYQVGKHLFGKHRLCKPTLSENTKSEYSRRLHEKYDR
jgi:hypothetical protein